MNEARPLTMRAGRYSLGLDRLKIMLEGTCKARYPTKKIETAREYCSDVSCKSLSIPAALALPILLVQSRKTSLRTTHLFLSRSVATSQRRADIQDA
jgi:hypothetical protein